MEFEPITFSIEEKGYPLIKDSASGKRELLPEDIDWSHLFGKDYEGQFVLRHPNLGDRAKISAATQNALIKAGFQDLTNVNPMIRDMEYGFAVVEIMATKKPDWFSRELLSSDLDMLAVAEVGRSFNTEVEQKKRPSLNGSR